MPIIYLRFQKIWTYPVVFSSWLMPWTRLPCREVVITRTPIWPERGMKLICNLMKSKVKCTKSLAKQSETTSKVREGKDREDVSILTTKFLIRRNSPYEPAGVRRLQPWWEHPRGQPGESQNIYLIWPHSPGFLTLPLPACSSVVPPGHITIPLQLYRNRL